MKLIYFVPLLLISTIAVYGQARLSDFNFLVEDIATHQIPDSISIQIKKNDCRVFILENQYVKKFKQGAHLNQFCILTGEEIFLEDPKFYLEFKRLRINSKRAKISLVITQRNPFKKVQVWKKVFLYQKFKDEWKVK